MAATSPIEIRNTPSGLRVLSLDGGGVRGISSLYILRHILKRLNPDNSQNPCDYFHIIAGTSTGGLIALMLGRLRMSVSDCIEAYKKLSARVFKPKRARINVIGRGKDLWSLSGSFDADELARAIREIVEQSGESGDAKLLSTDSRCRVPLDSSVHSEKRLENPSGFEATEHLWQLMKSTALLWKPREQRQLRLLFLKALSLMTRRFVDGALGFNNPVDEVLDEVEQIWSPSEFQIERFLSIGTGRPPIHALGGNIKEVAASIIKISTETEQTAQRFEQRALRTHGLSGQYFRFNARGLENVALEDDRSFGLIVAATNSYLNEPDTFQKLNRFVSLGSPFPGSSERYAYLASLRWAVAPRYAGSGPWAYRQLLKSFEAVLTSPNNTGIICMIDAIDECHEASRRQFVKDLALVSEAIHHKSSSGFSRIIVTSRNYNDIRIPGAHCLNLDGRVEMRDDIQFFIDVKVEELIASNRPAFRGQKSHIIDVLAARADGMYRLVELVIQDLECITDSSLASIERTLKQVPQDIGEMYDRIWDRIPPQHMHRAKRIFMWILFSLEPLSPQALQVCAAWSCNPQGIARIDVQNDLPSDIVGDVSALFGPLIRTGISIQVSHPSVRDHFIRYDSHNQCEWPNTRDRGDYFLPQQSHADIAFHCLKFLNSQHSGVLPDPRYNTEPNGFLSYGLNNFAKHVALAAPNHDALDQEIVQFFERGHWLENWTRSSPHDFLLSKAALIPPIEDWLSFGCYYGRYNLIKQFRFASYQENRGLLLDAKSLTVKAIYLALVGLNERCLMESILLLDMTMFQPSSPITFLSLVSKEEMGISGTETLRQCTNNRVEEYWYQAIIDQANIFQSIQKTIDNLTVGSRAVTRSPTDIKALWERLTRVYGTLTSPSSPSMGVQLEHEDWAYILALIISLYTLWTYGSASIDLLDPKSTILIEAANRNRFKAIKILIEEGIEIADIRDESGATILHLAAATGNYDMVEEILNTKQIEINATDIFGKTPLHYACSSSPMRNSRDTLTGPETSISLARVVYLLLQARADRTPRDYLGNTPFQHLSRVYVPEWDDIPKDSVLNWREKDLADTITLLLQDLTDILEWDSHGVTPLHYAAYLWPFSAVQVLLQFLRTFYVSGNIVDHLGHTPLHYAAIRGFDSPQRVVDILCQSGIDPRIQNITGETAVGVASSYGRTATAETTAKYENQFNDASLRLRSGNDLPSMSNIRIFDAGSSRLGFSPTRPVLEIESQQLGVQLSQPPSQQPSIAKSLQSRIIQRPPRIQGLEFPSMELQHQMRLAKQYLANNVQRNIDEIIIPSAILKLMSHRIYDLQTIEPFGKIHLEPLNRPATQGRLGIAESKVDADLTERYSNITSYQPRLALEGSKEENKEQILRFQKAIRQYQKPPLRKVKRPLTERAPNVFSPSRVRFRRAVRRYQKPPLPKLKRPLTEHAPNEFSPIVKGRLWILQGMESKGLIICAVGLFTAHYVIRVFYVLPGGELGDALRDVDEF
ncbi:hypothetical protein NUW58_g1421 [Xylaria curta]|uniref:Uncharacterized protein n=1 Tax=Xylaria curta TaxID=42375 RepID=A0ACC1PLF1_9PEZI|nr:hypothetical protein NUW58_g1421 [Xylaria curta]